VGEVRDRRRTGRTEGVPRNGAVLRQRPRRYSDASAAAGPSLDDRPRDLHAGRRSARSSTTGQGRQRARRADRDDLAGCDRNNQSRPLGQPAQAVCPGRPVPTRSSSIIFPSTAKWEFTPDGQHIELGIAEMNLFLLLGAAGLSHSLFGKRLIPIGTVYDPFVARGLDALNYACYQDARFMIVGTPSGVTLAPEGGAHQSIGTPLIGMSQDGLAASSRPLPTSWPSSWNGPSTTCSAMAKAIRTNAPGCATRPAARSICASPPTRSSSPATRADEDFRQGAIDGAYWLRKPGPNCESSSPIRACRARSDPRLRAASANDRRDVGVLAVTSADRLNAGWTAAQRARARGNPSAKSHIETLMAGCAPALQDVTVIDGHPATLAWIGSCARPPDDSRSASSISARPARSAISTGISMPRPSCRQPSVCPKDAGACRR
jgi:hypothetical protein